MIVIDAKIRIERDVAAVFGYAANPENFPAWNSAVTAVRPTSRSTYLMTRQLPTGAATNELQVVASESPTRFSIETTSGPTPFHYEYTLDDDGDATVLRLHARADLGPLAEVLGPLARHGLGRGIGANLEALKHILEHEPSPRGRSAT
jgi:hypothetical protein